MATTITVGSGATANDVVGKSVSQQDETNYLACRSGSGEGGGTEGTGAQQMNIGIRAEKTKAQASPVVGTFSYTIMRHIIRFIISEELPANAQVTDATLQLTSGGVTQNLDSDTDFSYATSSVSVVAATGTGLIAVGDYDSVNITDGTGDLTDRGMTFRTYDDIDSGSAVPQTNGGTVTIQLNQNAFDDITSTASGSSFDVGIINTKFDKAGTVANPGSFLSGSEPGTPLLSAADTDGQFTPPGNEFGLTGVDVHHEGTFIKFFGELGYGSGRPILTYTYKELQPAGKVTIDNKLVLSSGVVSLKSSLI
jgi:hypothetical protein